MPERRASTPLFECPDEGAAGQASAAEAGARRVAVVLPLPLGGAYDYLAPPDQPLAPGDLVEVPFGRRVLHGVVWDGESADGDRLPESRLKAVRRRIGEVRLPEVERRFLEWLADYYVAPLGAVVRMALNVPSALEPPAPVVAYALAHEDPLAAAAQAGLRITPARRRVIEELQGGPARPLAELARAAAVGPGVVKGLVAADLLVPVALPARRASQAPDPERTGPLLSDEQRAAADHLIERITRGGFAVTLLDGVTGSGKTEVYLEALAAALRQPAGDAGPGPQALVLLPEIALSAQWLERFEARFGAPPAVWHSDLTARQRRDTWRAVAEGTARVVVGARSALFLPFPDLRLIVVDEEQDAAFKQEDGVPYQARDMAVVRGRLGGFPVVLVSATPSLESLTNVARARYDEVRLSGRHGSAELPRVELVDLRADKPQPLPNGAQSWLSARLRAELSATLGAGEQALLFLNRRGYAPLTLCRACGHRLACPSCTAWLVEHRLAGRLQCHHCGYAVPLPESCPACGATGSLAACGPGVERLAEEVALLFPEARAEIFASDSLTGPAAAAELLRRIEAREIDLVIGTQIVAKGHHFPHLTLVGVVDADLGLYGGDLRAAERTFQLLQQVAGRAGRAERPGRALLQTSDPDHPVMQALQAGDREAFVAVESEIRETAGLPPFGRLAALIVSGPDPEEVDGLCAELARRAPRQAGVDILGPAPAPFAVLRGRHRRRFLVKAGRDRRLQPLLRAWLSPLRLPARLRLQVDVDPYSFL